MDRTLRGYDSARSKTEVGYLPLFFPVEKRRKSERNFRAHRFPRFIRDIPRKEAELGGQQLRFAERERWNVSPIFDISLRNESAASGKRFPHLPFAASAAVHAVFVRHVRNRFAAREGAGAVTATAPIKVNALTSKK